MPLEGPALERVLIVGHRGAEALAPENTWAALKAGYEAGADLLELDVQLTRDGRAIVLHDFSLQRKFGQLRWIRDIDWDELKDLDVGGWFSPNFAGERIPLFSDVLEWARGRIPLWVDLKHGFVDGDDDRLEMVALDLIEEAGMDAQVVISSWDQVALDRIRARCPQIPLVVNLPQRLPDPVGYLAAAGARWVAAFWPQTDRRLVAELQEAGIIVVLVGLFTNDYAEVLRLGVDAVTATDPVAARTALAREQGNG